MTWGRGYAGPSVGRTRLLLVPEELPWGAVDTRQDTVVAVVVDERGRVLAGALIDEVGAEDRGRVVECCREWAVDRAVVNGACVVDT